MKKITLVTALCCCAAGLAAQKAASVVGIIPQPVACTAQAGEFVVTPAAKIVLAADNEPMRRAVAVLNDLFKTAAGFTLPIAAGDPSGAGVIYCALNPKLGGGEAYKLSVGKNQVRIEAASPNGIFFATQTLRQLLPPQIESPQRAWGVKWAIPCVEISDAPAYKYRGLHLDVGRHFINKQDVMRYIDLLAYHKLNTFHWHLTEDQGWRIEIKKYPRLTTIGQRRSREQTGERDALGRQRRVWKDEQHSGFYTQDDIREVLAYAEKRFVNVIPEIELPGHAKAALAAYPELSCTGGPFEVDGEWGVREDIFCTRDTVFTFLENVLTEVAALFPSKYIHIGGDEAPKVRWERCHACQQRIKQEGLKDEHELQSYFITRMEKFLLTKGKNIIGWDEILEGGLAPNATVMSWRGEDGGIAAARQHHDVIMTPNSHMYLDYYQANPKTEPYTIGGYLPLWNVYSYNPTPAVLKPDEAKHILGVQGNVWTEYMPDFASVMYMTYPRAAAVAEVGWTPLPQKDYASFEQRLEIIKKRYEVMGVPYRK